MADVNSKQYDVFANPVRGKVDEGVLTGRLRRAVATVEVGSSDLSDNGDKAKLTWLPKGAFLHEVGIYTDGVGGATDNDLGDANSADGLADGVDLSSPDQVEVIEDGAGGTNGVSFPADAAKQLWEILGYAKKADAPAQIEIWLTANSGSGTDTGNIAVEFSYVDH